MLFCGYAFVIVILQSLEKSLLMKVINAFSVLLNICLFHAIFVSSEVAINNHNDHP